MFSETDTWAQAKEFEKRTVDDPDSELNTILAAKNAKSFQMRVTHIPVRKFPHRPRRPLVCSKCIYIPVRNGKFIFHFVLETEEKVSPAIQKRSHNILPPVQRMFQQIFRQIFLLGSELFGRPSAGCEGYQGTTESPIPPRPFCIQSKWTTSSLLGPRRPKIRGHHQLKKIYEIQF